jgi:hypothetical protein
LSWKRILRSRAARHFYEQKNRISHNSPRPAARRNIRPGKTPPRLAGKSATFPRLGTILYTRDRIASKSLYFPVQKVQNLASVPDPASPAVWKYK